MTDYKIGDLLQHKTGDIGIVVGIIPIVKSGLKHRVGDMVYDRGSKYRVLVHWFDGDELEPSALPESAEALKVNTKKL